MKLFKKPWFALLLCLILVFAATSISTNLRLGMKCREVSDSFYEGVMTDEGYLQPGIGTHLRNLTGYVDGLVTIAKNYDIDTDDVQGDNNLLKMILGDEDQDLSSIRYWYDALRGSVVALEDALSRTDLSERDASGVQQYSEGIHGAISSIESSSYNDTVRQFLREYDRFPVSFYASLGMIDLPEIF